jgi:hypothetical protein
VVAAGASLAAPDCVCLFHQRHFKPGSGGADSRPAPGDAPADNQDIGFDFLFLVIAYGVGPRGRLTVLFQQIIPSGHYLLSFYKFELILIQYLVSLFIQVALKFESADLSQVEDDAPGLHPLVLNFPVGYR